MSAPRLQATSVGRDRLQSVRPVLPLRFRWSAKAAKKSSIRVKKIVAAGELTEGSATTTSSATPIASAHGASAAQRSRQRLASSPRLLDRSMSFVSHLTFPNIVSAADAAHGARRATHHATPDRASRPS